MRTWYQVFRLALGQFVLYAKQEWRHAALQVQEALPATYQAASSRATKAGGPRTFPSHKIDPVILNGVLLCCRRIIESTPRYATYRGYFFHLLGINLKLSAQNIYGREHDSPLNLVFRNNTFINWYQQNPHNIVVDVGFGLNADPLHMSAEHRDYSLGWRFAPMRELMRSGWQMPVVNQYCHSYVVAGLRAEPLKEVKLGAGILKAQAYFKDMVQTYKHRDSSIGTNFRPKEALLLGDRKKFGDQMKALGDVWSEFGSYGVRLEFRLTAWAANRALSLEPQELVNRLFDAEAIVCPNNYISYH